MTHADMSTLMLCKELVAAPSVLPDGAVTPGQQSKIDDVAALLEEIGEPSVDERLDACILALTEIRDASL